MAPVSAPPADFEALRAAIHDALVERFGRVDEQELYGLPTFCVPLAHPPRREEIPGTLPHDRMTVCPTLKKVGITVHVWHPHAPTLLADNAAWLKEAGFKPMVGCVQWNRKTPFPKDAFERLLDAAQAAT